MKKFFLRMIIATGGQVLMYGYALITLVVMFVPSVISFFILTRNCNREDCLVGIGSVHYWPLFVAAGVFSSFVASCGFCSRIENGSMFFFQLPTFLEWCG